MKKTSEDGHAILDGQCELVEIKDNYSSSIDYIQRTYDEAVDNPGDSSPQGMPQRDDDSVLVFVPSKNTSIQPSVLLRTPIFSPVGRKTNVTIVEDDLSKELSQLEICKKEGFDRVVLKGPALNMETDFRLWCGLLRVFSSNDLKLEEIRVSFKKFCELCGYPPSRMRARLRESIKASLSRISMKRVEMDKMVDDKLKVLNTGLVLKAYLDEEADEVILLGDPQLWELYRIDHQILVSQLVLQALPRSETAQALYVFFCSLPENPLPVSMERLRARCNLALAKEKEQNRSIRNAIQKLENIGYLKGKWEEWRGKDCYHVQSRDTKMTLNSAE
ncbi:RepB family plasmid replication initiator protein [Vibrio mediterranei]|uniref:RepB family plasmid replication initiator protein n=1 Tax=Vibrio mediterranei TaxID=689 RepID=UPI00117DDD75|nr:RepB family plasmid replication initiator protein [Vibrio mediterranei]